MSNIVRLDIGLLLPEVPDDRDLCVRRLGTLLEGRPGISQVHVGPDPNSTVEESDAVDGILCIHYDPEQITVSQVTALARSSGAELTERYGHVTIPFRPTGPEDRGGSIEAAMKGVSGVTGASVNLAGGVVRVEFDRDKTDAGAIQQRLAEVAPPATEAPVPGDKSRQTAGAAVPPSWYRRNRELAWSLLCGVLAGLGWFASRLPSLEAAAIPIFLGAYAFGAGDNLSHLFGSLRRGRFRFNIDLLMVVAAIGAAILGEWFEGALLLFLFSLGHALEHYALGRARNAIKALSELAPTTAIVRNGDIDARVPIEEVRTDDLVVVRPSDRLAVDGVVHEGRSAVNQAPITGESIPVEKAPKDQVFAGSVNGDGVLVVRVTAAVGDRTLDRIIKLVAEAETQKAPTQQFTDSFEKYFVPIVLVGDILLIIVPPLLGVWTWAESFYKGMALLVAASPCALALGTPAAVLSGIAQAARRGVLIKGGLYLETLGKVDTLALDKTGTITRGEPAVTDLLPEPGISEKALLSAAAAVERSSQHPLAHAIVSAATKQQLPMAEAKDVESVTGQGIRARVAGELVEVGRMAMFDQTVAPPPASIVDSVASLEKAGRTTMAVRKVPASGPTEYQWLGVIGVSDQPRPGVTETLTRLRASGIRRIVMLTGDNAAVAKAVAQTVGIDEVRASLMPEDKVTAIRELKSVGGIAMVGDGVNDAPALANATVGIAMGGAGTAAALETADIALMGDDLTRLPFAIGLSHRARGIIRQNLVISLGVILLLVFATVTGLAGIGAAVIIHEGSTLLVVGNALRLLLYEQL